MMRHHPYTVAITGVVLLSLGLFGCGDASFFDSSSSTTHERVETRTAESQLVPAFQLQGHSAWANEVAAEQLELQVETIRLDPVGSTDSEIILSPSESLTFDLREDQEREQLEPLDIPDADRYRVTVQLKSQTRSASTGDSSQPSCGEAGRVASDDDSSDGDPVPVPYTPGQELETQSASLSHAGPPSPLGDRTYRYVLGTVEIERGAQLLTMTMNTKEWGRVVQRRTERALADDTSCPEEKSRTGDHATATQGLETRGELFFGALAPHTDVRITSTTSLDAIVGR